MGNGGRRRFIGVALACGGLLAAGVAGSSPAFAQVAAPPTTAPAAAEPMLVTFSSDAALDAALEGPAAGGEQPAGAELEPLTEQVAAATLTDVEAEALLDQPGVVAVEPDGLVVAAERPDDPCYTSPGTCPPVGAWHVDALGLPAAWDVSHGTGVVVAIIDGGVDQSAPDLAGKVVGELDLTGGGMECPTHGTNGASLAAAATDNGIRIPGSGWDAQVLSIRALSLSGGVCQGFESRVIAGIDLAVRQRARVVNLSLTTTSLSTAMRSAIDRAIAGGTVVVAAAGNGNTSNPAAGFGGYPAAYAPVVSVGASSPSGSRASFSNHGSWVDVFAPGDEVQDPVSSSPPCAEPPGDCTIRGTSYAAPITSGVVALMLAIRPSLRAADVELLLERTAQPGPGGIRRVDARDALYDAAFRGYTPAGAGALGIGGAAVHLASRATDGSVWHRTLGGRWAQAGGGILGDPDLTSAGPGRIDVVGLGGDRRAWIRRLDVASAWQPVGTGRFSSSLSMVSTGPGRLELFGRGLDGALWHGTLDGGTFGGWRSLGGALAGEPDAVAVPGGPLVVLAAGTDGALWQRTFDGTRWLPWGSLGGRLTAGPGAVSWGPDRADVVVRGTDGAAYHRAWNGTGWTAWRALGGSITSAPDVATRGPGTLEVLARAGDHHLWRLPFDGGTWGGWRPTE